MIEYINVSKQYDSNKAIALTNINLRIKKGEFVFIVGSSGAGKSSLIRLLLKEEDPTSGKLILNGEDITHVTGRRVPYIRRSLGVVFQDFRLLENKTVFENVAFAMEIIGASKKQIERQVPQVIEMVGLKGKEKDYPDELSGGEQQRVSIARAIVNKPAVLIADEPTGNLDPDTAWEIMKVIKEINNRGTTVVMATHAKDIVNFMKRRVVALEGGKIVRDEEKGVYGYEA